MPFAFDDKKHAAQRWDDKAGVLQERAAKVSLLLRWLYFWRAHQCELRAFDVRAGTR